MRPVVRSLGPRFTLDFSSHSDTPMLIISASDAICQNHWYYVGIMWPEIETHAHTDHEMQELFPPARPPDRPLQAGLLCSPRDIELDGQRLIWNAQSTRYKHTRSAILDDFIGLCHAFDNCSADHYRSAVLSYARKWGVLGLCEHGLPCSHSQPPFGLNDGVRPCLPMLVTPLPAEGPYAVQYWEPLSVWYEWSRKAKALVNIAAQLNQGRKASFEDWNIVKGMRDTGLGETQAEPYVTDLQTARRELAWELDGWISLGQVRPRISWNRTPAGWRFSLDAVSTGPNLIGILALYIASEVAGTGKGSAICSSCTKWYRLERRLNPKHRNYCPECRGESGKQAARRDAARDFRRRQRENGRR